MNKLFVSALLSLACASAFAQSATTNAASGSTAAITAPIGNSFNVSPGYVQQDFKTNQAATPGTIVGNAASANGGCMSIIGENGSITILTLGKTRLEEGLGCMSNQMFDRVDTLRVGADGKFDKLSILKLQAWCAFPYYKDIIESSELYVCKPKLADRQQAAGTTTDPYIRQSGRQYPSPR